MTPLLTITSSAHAYPVEEYESLATALASVPTDGTLVLVDQFILDHYGAEIQKAAPQLKLLPLVATEEQKSFEQLAPIFVWLLKNGLKRDGLLLVIGGGVLQDIGCFIASVLSRGLRWEFIPTTLLAQADSCIGSKSSINIESYKNQIGTFYPPNRVLLVGALLKTLPWDEVRSGLGEVIKLHLLAGEEPFRRVMEILANGRPDQAALMTCVHASLEIKKPYIEQDERDQGIRNILNYGHTFGHAYESATHYAIPHGISVILGMLTATYVSSCLGLVSRDYFQELQIQLAPWYQPYEQKLTPLPIDVIFAAIKLDKKNTRQGIHCILTRGAGRMEKIRVEMDLPQRVGEFTRLIAHDTK